MVIHLAVTFIIPAFFAMLKPFIFVNTHIWQFSRAIAKEGAPIKFYLCSLDIFLCTFPYFMNVICDFVSLMHVTFIVWDVNLVPADVQINNLDTVPKLGFVNNIVLSRSALFNTQSQEVVSVHCGGEILWNENEMENKENLQENLSDSDSMDSDEDAQELLDYLPNEVQKNKTFVNKKLSKLSEPGANKAQNEQF